MEEQENEKLKIEQNIESSRAEIMHLETRLFGKPNPDTESIEKVRGECTEV